MGGRMPDVTIIETALQPGTAVGVRIAITFTFAASILAGATAPVGARCQAIR